MFRKGKGRRTERPPEVVAQVDQLRAEAREAIDNGLAIVLFVLREDGGIQQIGEQTMLNPEQLMMFLATCGQMLQAGMAGMMLASSLATDDEDDTDNES